MNLVYPKCFLSEVTIRQQRTTKWIFVKAVAIKISMKTHGIRNEPIKLRIFIKNQKNWKGAITQCACVSDDGWIEVSSSYFRAYYIMNNIYRMIWLAHAWWILIAQRSKFADRINIRDLKWRFALHDKRWPNTHFSYKIWRKNEITKWNPRISPQI